MPGKDKPEDLSRTKSKQTRKTYFCILSEFWIEAIVLGNLFESLSGWCYFIFSSKSLRSRDVSTVFHGNGLPEIWIILVYEHRVSPTTLTLVAIRIYSTETQSDGQPTFDPVANIRRSSFKISGRLVASKWLDFIGPCLPEANIPNELKKVGKIRVETRNCNNRTWNVLSTIVSMPIETATAMAIKSDRGVNLQFPWITMDRNRLWREMKFSNGIEIRMNESMNCFPDRSGSFGVLRRFLSPVPFRLWKYFHSWVTTI